MWTKTFEYLVKSITSDYIFIDLPYYSNIGDSLIWKGTEELLKDVPYNCLLRASFQTFQYPELSKETIILMMGGGNWGDLYIQHNEFRRNVVQRYPKNKIIVLPQTVYYEGARNARNDAKLFRQHKNLTICARDTYSYRFLKAFGFGQNIILMPDMAFCIRIENLKKFCKVPLHKDLLFKRVDKEKASIEIVDSLSNNYDIADWPLYEGYDYKCDRLYQLIDEYRYHEADDYAVNTYLPERVKTGVELISQYDRVFSNRLHGAILSILLGKDVYIYDNSYGKNSQYYNSWLKDFSNVHLLSNSKHFNFNRKKRFFVYFVISLIDRIRK